MIKSSRRDFIRAAAAGGGFRRRACSGRRCRRKAEVPQARMLMLTSSEAKEDARQSMAAGAAGYVNKSEAPEVLFAPQRLSADTA